MAELTEFVMKRSPIVVTQPECHGQVWPHFPIILSKESKTVHTHVLGEGRDLAGLGIECGRALVARSIVDEAPQVREIVCRMSAPRTLVVVLLLGEFAAELQNVAVVYLAERIFKRIGGFMEYARSGEEPCRE